MSRSKVRMDVATSRIIAALLEHSFRDIDNAFVGLTTEERAIVGNETRFSSVLEWVDNVNREQAHEEQDACEVIRVSATLRDIIRDLVRAVEDYGNLDVKADGTDAIKRIGTLARKLDRFTKQMLRDPE